MRVSIPSDAAFVHLGVSRLARPFLWLAALAFLVGFIGYLLLAGPVVAYTSQEPSARTISGPVSADWNIRKAI
jgi:hypothetical protein